MNEGRGVRLVPGLAVRAGQTIAGKYRVEELLGSGASGVVISARNIHLREQVTLKILASYTDGQDELTERRLAKARLASRLASAHVARIVDIGVTDDGMPYVATEALEGNTLEAELEERGPIDVAEATRWVLEACEGLAEAHAAGLVHGDLKPQNIFLARPPKARASRGSTSDTTPLDTRVLKLLDFGTTSPLDAIGDQSASAFFGSPAFLAPEQIQDPGSVDARADVWALGVLLYKLISGSLPFSADSLSGVIVAVVYDAPALLTDAPYELARIVSRCLEKDRNKRPQDVTELAAALAPFAGAQGARLSERVRAMLEAAPVSVPPAERAATTSVSPVSISSDGRDSDGGEPLPLVTKRAAQATVVTSRRDDATRPSRRVTARRRKSRARVVASGVLGAAAALALASWGLTRPVPAMVSETSADGEELAPTAAAGRETVDVPPYVPTDLGIASATAAELPDAPPDVSFAPTSPGSMTPTPLAVAVTPVAAAQLIGPPAPPARTIPASALPSASPFAPPTALPPPLPKTTTPAALPNAPAAAPRSVVQPPVTNAPRWRAAPPTPLPPPRATAPSMPGPPPRATTPSAPSRAGDATRPRANANANGAPISRLPAGLPTTRDALPASSAPSRPSSPKADETYLRRLLTDRK